MPWTSDRVNFFGTCLIDSFRPATGLAATRPIKREGDLSFKKVSVEGFYASDTDHFSHSNPWPLEPLNPQLRM
jgi:hypothetical protein